MRKSFFIILSLVLIISLILGGMILFNNPKPTPERKLLNEGDSNRYVNLSIESDYMVLNGTQKLIIIPNKSASVKLNVFLLSENNKTKVDYSNLDFKITHHASHNPNLGDPSKIISIDSEGNLRYLKEGYISLKVKYSPLSFESEEIIIATGDIYGNPKTDNVLAVFPKDYSPEESSYNFGYMINNYPQYISVINMAYNEISKLYGGFKPFGGNKQIFALLNLPNHCGGNMNPLETAPCCYMNCNDGSPQYDAVIHEMGHNFAYSKGMDQLLRAKNDRINSAGFGECVASLPLQYLRAKILESPQNYNIDENSFEYLNWASFQNQDNIWNKERLERFEGYIEEGSTKGIFDIDSLAPEKRDSLQGNIGAFCTFFVTPAAYPDEFGNSYSWEFYRRFFSFFGDKELSNFQEDKVETYFSAVYSASIGKDMREKLRFWGFNIDDEYFNQIYPQLVSSVS